MKVLKYSMQVFVNTAQATGTYCLSLKRNDITGVTTFVNWQ